MIWCQNTVLAACTDVLMQSVVGKPVSAVTCCFYWHLSQELELVRKRKKKSFYIFTYLEVAVGFRLYFELDSVI